MQSDSYKQLCQSLLELQNAADTIFDVITDRVVAEQHAVKKVSRRIKSARSKLDTIAGSKRAITMFSSAKYPAVAPEQADFAPLFGGNKAGDHKMLPAVSMNLTTGSGQENGDQGALELFRFFLETSHECWPTYRKPKEGIGGVPPHVKSVADIMLFNSTELPYHKYRVVDNLAGADQPLQEEAQSQPALPAPPQSVLHGGSMHAAGMDQYGFKPTVRQVPSFSLPPILPDLPMVADISWTGSQSGMDDVPSIAPSAAQSGSSPRKAGSMKSFVTTSSRSFRTASKGPARPFKPLDPQEGTSAARTEDLFARQSEDKAPHQQEKVQQEKVLQAPPPPPPLPPPLPPLSVRSSPVKPADKAVSSDPLQESGHPSRNVLTSGRSRQSESALASAPVVPALDTQRAALMASIRSPGIKLRKTEPTTDLSASSEKLVTSTKQSSGSRASDKEGPSSSQTQHVDVLAEMASSLKMRRLALKGASHDKPVIKAVQDESTVEPRKSSEAGSGTFTLPITKLHAYIARKNAELSDDDEWGE